MRQIWNQLSKDFKQLVYSPVFYLMMGFCAAIWGFVFPRKVFEFARVAGVNPFAQNGMNAGGYNIYETVFISHLSLTHILLLFIVPVFTMRMIAEEKKSRTFDLLMTAPISSTKIIIGKFFASYGVVCLLVLLSLSYPLVTIFFVDFNVTLLLSAYLAIALLVGVYTAIGLFSSSLTQSLMLSVFLGTGFNVSLHFISMSSQFSDNHIYTSIMNYLAVTYHLDHLFRGNIVMSSIIYFIIIISFFLFLTQRIIESSRWRSQ